MEELLNEQEIHTLGLQALSLWLEKHNFVVDYMQTEKCVVPHVFALSGKVLTVIVAACLLYTSDAADD